MLGQLGVSSFNPILFAFIREASAGPILLLGAYMQGLQWPRVQDARWFFLAATSLFVNQSCMIMGVKLAGGVIGAALAAFATDFHVGYFYVAGLGVTIMPPDQWSWFSVHWSGENFPPSNCLRFLGQVLMLWRGGRKEVLEILIMLALCQHNTPKHAGFHCVDRSS